MALTATLNDVNPSNNVVQTPGGGGGFISGLSRFGSALVGAAGKADAVAQQKETQAAANDAAQLVQTRFSVQQAAMNPVDVQTSSMPTADDPLPTEVTTMANQLSKVQQSVKQGSLPASALNLRLESGIDELFRLHPERKAQIAQYFTSQGLDHYVFRDVKAAYAAEANAVATQQSAENAAYEAGAKAGLFNPEQTSRSEGILLGQQWLQKKAQFDLGKEQINLAKTKLEISEMERKAALDTGERNLTQAIIGDADQRVGQLVQGLGVLNMEANTDPTGQKLTLLKEALPQVAQGILTAKASAIAQVYAGGGGKAQADAVADYYDQQYEGIVRLHTGDLAKDKLNQQILQGMQTQFSIQAAQAFPLWNQLAKLPGMANALPLLFSGDPAHQLSKEQQSAIQKELSGWRPGSTEGLYQIQRIADVLRGDLKLNQLSLPEAQRVIGGVNTAVVGNAQAVNAGDKTAATAKPLLTGLEQLSDAAFTLTPGVDPKSQLRAAQILGNPETGNALVALAKDPQHATEAVQVVVSVRATAQKGIIVAKSGDWTKGNVGSLMTLKWDDKSQTVKQVLDEAAYQAYTKQVQALRSGHGVSGRSARQMDMDAQQVEILTRDQVIRRGDSTLATRAETINKYLDTLVRTMPVDPTVPAGITPAQARKAAFLGETLDNVAKDGAKADPFAQRLKALEQQAQSLNDTTIKNSTDDRNRQRYEPIAHREADKLGVPRAVASFLFGQESGWDAAIGQTRIDNNGDGKPDSSAVGIGQIIKSTGKELGLVDEAKGIDLRGDATKAIPAALTYLRDLYKKTGSWEKALEAYGVTHRSNFKTEKAYNEVINRARQAIQGD